MKTFIYTLEHPITNEIRYVGKTNSPDRRLHYHWTVGFKSNNKTGNWLKSLKKINLKPIMTIIDESEDDWQLIEQYWIQQFRCWGFRLTNHTHGGEGSYGGGQWNNTPITLFNKSGVKIKSFDSLKLCSEYLKCDSGNIVAAAKGRIILLKKKYQVRYGIIDNNIDPCKSRKEYEWHSIPDKHWLKKPIICVEDGLVFDSITDASKHYNILITSINNILNGRAKKTRCGKSFSRI